jgi:hypothetical protein
MGASLFKTLTVVHHSSSTQFVPRLLRAEEIFTLQLPSLAVGIGSSISLSLSLSLSKKRLLFKLYFDYSLLYCGLAFCFAACSSLCVLFLQNFMCLDCLVGVFRSVICIALFSF